MTAQVSSETSTLAPGRTAWCVTLDAWAARAVFQCAEPVSVVRCFETTPEGIRAFRRLNDRTGVPVGLEPITTATNEIKGEDGRSAVFSIAETAVRLASKHYDAVFGNSPVVRLAGQAYRTGMMEAYFRHRFGYLLLDWVKLLVFSHVPGRSGPAGQDPDVVLLPQHDLGTGVESDLRQINPGAAILFYEERMPVLGPFAAEEAATLRSVPGRLLRELRSLGPLGRGRSARPERDRVRVATEHVWGADVSRRCDFFWYPYSGAEWSDLLVYFDRTDRPATPEVTRRLDGMGAGSIALTAEAGQGQAPVWQPGIRLALFKIRSLGLLGRLLPMALRNSHPGARWQWNILRRAVPAIDRWRTFFEEFNVKLNSSYSGQANESHFFQSIALDSTGGLNTRSIYSHLFHDHPGHAVSTQVFFSWGPYIDEYLKAIGPGAGSATVHCGYIFDNMFEGARSRAGEVRTSLRDAGAEFVICLFDEALSPDAPNTESSWLSFYETFLQAVLDDGTLGVVIKPKGEIPAGTGLDTLLSKAQETGRCVVLESAMPCEAAMASDIAVGLGINSAVIEAALAGVRAVHVDLARQDRHRFYGAGYESIVFDDLGRAVGAIERYRRNAGSERALGDHSRVLDEIDPFRDGGAAERVGKYMGWLLEGFRKGQEPADVLREASRRYREGHGPETLSRPATEPSEASELAVQR